MRIPARRSPAVGGGLDDSAERGHHDLTLCKTPASGANRDDRGFFYWTHRRISASSRRRNRSASETNIFNEIRSVQADRTSGRPFATSPPDSWQHKEGGSRRRVDGTFCPGGEGHFRSSRNYGDPRQPHPPRTMSRAKRGYYEPDCLEASLGKGD